MKVLEWNLDRLRRLEGLESIDERQAVVTIVLDDTFEIGCAVELDPDLLRQPEMQQYLAEANARLLPAVRSVQEYVDATADRFDNALDEGEYAYLALRRSSVEFLRQFSVGTELEGPAKGIRLDALDELIRANGDPALGPDEIPEGIPASHWWWWQS